jgi:hypothetical protein
MRNAMAMLITKYYLSHTLQINIRLALDRTAYLGRVVNISLGRFFRRCYDLFNLGE